jgi:signal transduction histidine kinase
MRRAERIARAWRRADTRAVLAVGCALVLTLGLQAVSISAYVSIEALEQADDWLQKARRLVDSLDAAGASGDALLDAANETLTGRERAMRLLVAGSAPLQRGHWPPPDSITPALLSEGPDRGLGSIFLLRRNGFLVDSIELSGGRTLELALPLKPFAREAWEIARLLALLVLLSSIIAFGAALFATRRAFSPLRAGTQLLEGVDAQHLSARLPTRSTGDPLDRHAETLNRVLGGIENSFERLRSFSSDVAHELRTPLNRIRTVAGVALADGGQEELTAALERIQDSVEELGRMVDALLLIAEVDDGRVPLKLEQMDVDAWLRQTVETWAPAFEERGVTLSLHSAAGTAQADRTLLDRVLSNLLDNAARHGAAGGRVALDASGDDAGLVIALDDAGPGISERDRERVFERFARLDRSQRGGSGGLGLALARAVARRLGGQLVAEGSQLGGARFVWRLPRAAPARATVRAASEPGH